MKIKLNIKSIILMTIIALASLLFINISFAANTGKVIVETAKLREQAHTDSKVLDLASQGDEVEILNEEDQWYKVKYKQITGYIRKDLIKLDNKETANAINSNEQTNEENKNTTENTVDDSKKSNETLENDQTEKTDTDEKEKTEEIAKNQKYKITENVKIKVIPLISSIELDEVKKDDEVEAVEILNDWVKIKTSNEKEGWIRKEKLTTIKTETENTEDTTTDTTTTQTAAETNTTQTNTAQNQTKTMYVNVQTANLRQKADKTSQVVKQLTQNTKVTVTSSENGWAYVDVNGTKGYIAETLLSSTQKETSRSGLTTREQSANTTNQTKKTNTSKTVTESTSTSQSGNSVVSYAKQFLGCKYVYGGTSPSGFDCSGFTQYVYKHFGVNLNRTAAAQYSNGKSVTSLQAGDLVMFGKSGINHVGIYIGGNTFIHAANKSQGVRTDSMSTGYYKTNYIGARRIF